MLETEVVAELVGERVQDLAAREQSRGLGSGEGYLVPDIWCDAPVLVLVKMGQSDVFSFV